jgi:hypothetical protein
MGTHSYDVFISHASEDKRAVAEPLAKFLEQRGYKVWLDRQELRLGDQLRRKINQGLSRSRYGVVILSKAFFAKKWPMEELDALMGREGIETTIVLPVRHGLSQEQVRDYHPTVANKLSASTDDGLQNIVEQIAAVLDDQPVPQTASASDIRQQHADLFDPHRGRQPRGDNNRYIRREDVARILADLLYSGSYQAGSDDGNGSSDDITSFHENSAYWEQARRQSFFHGQRVNLGGFWITEWTPFSPGHYFTDEAKGNRDLATRYLHDGRDEYLPLGKNYMMLGGVGSLRFAPKRIGGNDVFVLGASSSGVSHEGIPLTCEQDIYRHVAQNLKQAGGVRCNVHGYMRHLPNEISKLTFSQEVEKYCIHMIDIDVQDVARHGDLLCTAQILFPSTYPTYSGNDSDEYFEGDGYKTRLVKSWSFASFRPGHDIGKGMISLTQAATWLEEYAKRYGGERGERAPLLNDFDEIQNHFSSPIEFPLAAVKAGNINLERLEGYQRYLGSSIVRR